MSDMELLTTAEYARLRRCSLRTLDRERATGTGCPYVRLGARIFYRRSDIEHYIETHVGGREDGRELVGIGSTGSPSDIKAFDTDVKHPEANSWRQNDRRRIQRRLTAAGTTANTPDRSRGSAAATVRPARNVILAGASHERSTRPPSYREQGRAANRHQGAVRLGQR